MPSIETNPRERSICAARHKTVRAESCGNLLSSRKPQACAKKRIAFRFYLAAASGVRPAASGPLAAVPRQQED